MEQQDIREAVLVATRDWMLADEVQTEVVAARERLGEARPHVPIQLVAQALDELVEDGQLERQTGELVAGAFLEGSGDRVRFRWAADMLAAGSARLAAILRHLLPPPGLPEQSLDVDEVCTALYAEGLEAPARLVADDLEMLRRATLIASETVDGREVYCLREQAIATLCAAGAQELAQQAWPYDRGSSPGPSDGFVAEVTRELAAEKRRRTTAEDQVARLRKWLEDHDVDADALLGVEKPTTNITKTFFWTSKPRKIDDAEKGQMLQEIIALDAQIAQHRGELEANRDFHKGKIKGLEKSIAELKHLSTCDERVLELEAYRETDWEAGVDIIRAASDGRELAREPIPRGTQRPLLDPTGAPSERPAQPATQDGPRIYTDGRTEALELLRAGDGLTQQELLAAIGEGWVCPGGWELQARKAIAQLAKEGTVRIVQGRPPRYKLEKASNGDDAKATSSAARAPVAADDLENDEDDDRDDEDLAPDSDPSSDHDDDAPDSEPAPRPARKHTPKRAAKRAPRPR